jgi:hypothetical protein
MAYGTRVGFEPLRSIAAASITNSYVILGGATTGHIRIFNVTNATNQDVLVSLDGVNDHMRIAAASFQLFDFTSNKVRDDGFFLSQGTFFYIKYPGAAPSAGNLWIEVISAVAGGV